MTRFEALGAVTNLLSYSWLHTDWTITDLHKRVVPPLELGQHCMVWVDDFLSGFGTYAWLNDEDHAAMLEDRMEWRADAWSGGSHFWMVDVVAPWGHGAQILLTLRAKLRAEGHAGIRLNYRRRYINRPNKRTAEVAL